MTEDNCSLILGIYNRRRCRTRTIMGNRAPLTSNVPASEQ
jgi:hypothetical protein